MIEKLTDYINHIFKIRNISDEEMKQEIIANQIDRYNDYLSKGMDEETAYLKTIKSLGNIGGKEDEQVKFEDKTTWPYMAPYLALGLAVIATIVVLIKISLSILFITTSISIFIASAYYLYHKSQHALNVLGDVNKHNSLLKEIFNNLKTIFIFWNINISFWIASIVAGIIAPIIIAENGFQPIFVYLIVYFVVIAISFTIIFFILNAVYVKLQVKYYELTQDDSLLVDSDVKGGSKKKVNVSSVKLVTPKSKHIFKVILLSIYFIALNIIPFFIVTTGNTFTAYEHYIPLFLITEWYLIVLFVLLNLIGIVLIVKTATKSTKKITPIFTYLFLIAIDLSYLIYALVKYDRLANSIVDLSDYRGIFYVFHLIIITMMIIFKIFGRFNKKEKEDNVTA